MDGKHDRTTSGVTCHHHPWTARMIGRRQAWHVITSLGQHTRSNYVGRGMPSSPLGSTHGRTMSGVTCQHRLKVAHTVERRGAWHGITAFGQHTRSNDVERDMPSFPLESTHGRTTLGMACHHHLWAAQMVGRTWAWHAIVSLGWQTRSNNVRRGMPSSPLGSTHGRHRRAWHAIIALGHHTRSNKVCRRMPS